MQQVQDGIFKLPLMMWSPLFWFGGQFGVAEPVKSEAAATKPAATVAPVQSALNVGSGVLKAGAQANSEVLGLMTRRSKAMLALSADAAKCRTPQDLVGLQMQYWQTAIQQYSEATRRIAAAWNVALPPMQAAANSAGATPQRDRLTFAEPEAAAIGVTSQPVRTQGDRRSAA